MKAYIYKAALYCESCAKKIMEQLDKQGKKPVNVADESSYDSDDYPKGPYGNGGGEADSYQHCDDCGEFLANPLTSEGVGYSVEALQSYVNNGRGSADVLDLWATDLREYGLEGEQRTTLDRYLDKRSEEKHGTN